MRTKEEILKEVDDISSSKAGFFGLSPEMGSAIVLYKIMEVLIDLRDVLADKSNGL